MLYSQLFGKTVKDISQDTKLLSHRYLIQGGYIRESVAGRYFFLPLGLKVREKIIKIIEEEMNLSGAQKMIAPILHPLELWEETKRTESVGFELMQVKDRRGAKFALGGTAEEMMVDVVRKFNISYKELPFNIYQFSQKFRDEKRARGGLLRTREFLMKDAYSFHRNSDDFKSEYEKMANTYTRIFERMGLQTVKIEADNGYIGGEYCHEFVVVSEDGESRFLMTKDLTYAAHEEVATFRREFFNQAEELLPVMIQDAKRGPTIEAGVNLYNKPAWRQIKSLIYVTDQNEKILVCLRGDLDINEAKLIKILGCNEVRLASVDEISELGTVLGFVSPLKLKIKKIGDLSLKTVVNFYTGADVFEKDTLNVNYGRDFEVDILTDIALPPANCQTNTGEILIEGKGIEVGNIFQLGTHYTEKMQGANFTDQDGSEKPFYMGCYGIGVDRTLATIVEMYHDDDGIIWPKEVAPFLLHLLLLGNDEDVKLAAEKLYQDFLSAGIEILFDDRSESAGKKFKDADLLGMPYRLVISKKSLLENKIEVRKRASKEIFYLDLAEAILYFKKVL